MSIIYNDYSLACSIGFFITGVNVDIFTFVFPGTPDIILGLKGEYTMEKYQNNLSSAELAVLTQEGLAWFDKMSREPTSLLARVAVNEELNSDNLKTEVFDLLFSEPFIGQDTAEADYREYISDEGYYIKEFQWRLEHRGQVYALAENYFSESASIWSNAVSTNGHSVAYAFEESSAFPLIIDPQNPEVPENHQFMLHEPLAASSWYKVKQSLVEMKGAFEHNQMLRELDKLFEDHSTTGGFTREGVASTVETLWTNDIDETAWTFQRVDTDKAGQMDSKYVLRLEDPRNVRGNFVLELDKENVRPHIRGHVSNYRGDQYYLNQFKIGVELLKRNLTD